jgi:hypothetical protein
VQLLSVHTKNVLRARFTKSLLNAFFKLEIRSIRGCAREKTINVNGGNFISDSIAVPAAAEKASRNMDSHHNMISPLVVVGTLSDVADGILVNLQEDKDGKWSGAGRQHSGEYQAVEGIR